MQSPVSGFSYGVLEARRVSPFTGLDWTGLLYSPIRMRNSAFAVRFQPFTLKAWLGVLGEFGDVLYADHVRFDPRHPHIERLPTL